MSGLFPAERKFLKKVHLIIHFFGAIYKMFFLFCFRVLVVFAHKNQIGVFSHVKALITLQPYTGILWGHGRILGPLILEEDEYVFLLIPKY